MVALARGMLYDPRWGWHAAAELGGHVAAPPAYWRAPPHEQKDLFGTTTFGTRVNGRRPGHFRISLSRHISALSKAGN